MSPSMLHVGEAHLRYRASSLAGLGGKAATCVETNVTPERRQKKRIARSRGEVAQYHNAHSPMNASNKIT